MNLQKDIDELLKAQVISPEIAERIQVYYKQKGSSSINKLFVVFGILGAILVGLGIILIIAHNWDNLSKQFKTAFAFLPLLIGQALCLFVLYKKSESMAWRESVTSFLFFAVGASISLISQIYHIPGDLGSYFLSWSLLCLPLVYIMRSSMASLLYLITISYYACYVGYWSYPLTQPFWYWLLLMALLPHYYHLYKKKGNSNFMIFHNWLLPLSLILVLGAMAQSYGELMFIAYVSLFGLFYQIGSWRFFEAQKIRNNGFELIGNLGTIIILLILSFDWFWKELRDETFVMTELLSAPELYISVCISLLALIVFYLNLRRTTLRNMKPIAPVFILFIVIYLLGMLTPFAVVFINICVFIIGLLTIQRGVKKNHLGILNYGLIVITALIACRFFDTDLSFVLRGVLFISVGTGFFVANYWMLKKRNAHE